MRSSELTIEHALLGFLEQGPLHGYQIHQQLQASQALGLVWRIKQAHLYALLAKLEAAGLLSGEIVAQEARPPRRLLQLTEAGRTAFHAWLQRPVAHGRDLRIEFLAKLFWAQRHGGVEQLIAAQRTACQSWLDALHAEERLPASEAAQPYTWLVRQFRVGQLEAAQRWLESCALALAQPEAPA